MDITKRYNVPDFQKKTPSFRMTFDFYGWGTWIRTMEMPDSESGALPLGYTPRCLYIIYFFLSFGNCLLKKKSSWFKIIEKG